MTVKNAIITSASSKFFPSLINLLGSIKTNYPNHPDVYIYDIGLFYTFRKELEEIPWVHILEIPHFTVHWRSCYTWKTYILNTPLAENNLYIDAGSQVLKPLNELFEKINARGYLAVSQGPTVKIHDICPEDYFARYNIDERTYSQEVITAGIFGFKRNSPIQTVTRELYVAGVQGFCLGFSKTEQWKNKGVNKNNYVRNCRMFRHDTTLLTILLRKMMPDTIVESIEHFSSQMENNVNQFIWNFRLNFKNLRYVGSGILHKKIDFFVFINRVYISIFIYVKVIVNGLNKK